MAMASIWRRAWSWRRRASSTAPQEGRGSDDGAGGYDPLQPTSGDSTTYTSTATFDSAGTRPWRYREQSGSICYSVSNSSGTIVSTNYTSGTLSSISMEAAVRVDWEDFDAAVSSCKETEEKMKKILQEFFAAPSANCSGDMSVLERWFAELGVAWVLHLADGTSASVGELEYTSAARSWIRALKEIMRTIRATTSLLPDHGAVDLPSIYEEEPETESGGKATSISDQCHFPQFIQEAMLKLLAFVDVIVASNAKPTTEVLTGSGLVLPYEKISALLGVNDALVSVQLLLPIHAVPFEEFARSEGGIISVLSSKEHRTCEAIWSTMEQVRIELIEDDNNWSRFLTPQGSSDIHEVTQSVMRYIRFIQSHYSSIHPVVSEAASLGKYAPRIRQVSPLISLVMEIAVGVEKMLANKSASFPDQSLRFLFLVNNSNFIRQQLHDTYSSLNIHAVITRKVEEYIENYIQISWAPVLSCLLDATPPSFWTNYSSLFKFETEFQKIYATQKQWKVQDPKLRKRLRNAITEKIIPDYTKYIEDNNVSTPKFTSHELGELLQEIFEG